MKDVIFIEGFENCYGTYKPDWSEHQLKGGLQKELLKVKKSITPFGGIEKVSDLEFKLNDVDEKLANSIQFRNNNRRNVVSPSPLVSDDITVELDDINHPFAKSFSVTSRKTLSDDYNIVGQSYTSYFFIKPTAAGVEFLIDNRNADIQGTAFFTTSTRALYVFHRTATSYYRATGNNFYDLNKWGLFVVKFDASTTNLKVRYRQLDTAWSNYSSTIPVPFTYTGTISLLGRWNDIQQFTGEVYKIDLYDYYRTDDEDDEYFEGIGEGNIFSLQYINYSSKNLIEKVQNENIVFSTIAWTSREILPGDLVYAPLDTWRVSDVDISNKEILVERGIYSALNPSYKPYYHQTSGNEYVIPVYFDNPNNWEGRLISYYRDDVLQYVGLINNITQHGKTFKFKTKYILKPLIDGLKDYNYTLTLKTNNGEKWWIQDLDFYVNDTQIYKQVRGPTTRENFPNYLSSPTLPELIFDEDHGFSFELDANADILRKPESEGLFDTLFTDPQNLNLTQFGSFKKVSIAPPDQVKEYGIIAAKDQVIQIEGNSASSFINNFIEISEGNYVQITSWNPVTGEITLDGVYDDNLKKYSLKTTGVSSDQPVKLKISLIAKANSIVELIYGLLSSTGSFSNGIYDRLGGILGLGIPKDLIDSTLTIGDLDTVIIADLSKGKVSQDLEANGLILTLENGKFTLKKHQIPIIVGSKFLVTDAKLNFNQKLTLNFGYYHPIKGFIYQGFSVDSVTKDLRNFTISTNIINSNIFVGSNAKIQKWQSSLNQVINKTYFIIRLLKLLDWFNNYAPAIQFNLPGENLNLGDNIVINTKSIVGAGKYGVESIPAIITEKGDFFNYTVILNTSDVSFFALWNPSWEIHSKSGVNLTLRKGEAEKIEELFPLPLNVVIRTNSNTILQSLQIVSVTDADTVVVNTAPTYNTDLYIGLLTLKDYTDTDVIPYQSSYVWASDSGQMSDFGDGKKYD